MIVAVDTECSGLDPYLGDKISRVGVLTDDGRRIFKPMRGLTTELRSLLRKATTVVGYHLKFDAHMFVKPGIEIPWNKVDDPLIFASLLDDQATSKSLLAMSMKHIDYDGAEDLAVDDWLHQHDYANKDYSRIPDKVLEPYTLKQLENTICLWALWRDAVYNTLGTAYTIEKELTPVLFEMERRGLLVDPRRLRRSVLRFEDLRDKHLRTLREIAGDPDFNPRSVKQVLGVLNKLQIDVSSTAADVLAPFVDDTPFIRALQKYRFCSKMLRDKLANIESRLDSDSVVHPSFSQTRTRTGRLACGNPNLQNNPSEEGEGKLVGDIFRVRPGYTAYSLDYSQMELRVALAEARDEEGLKLLRTGRSVHIEVALRMYGKGYSLKQLLRAKAANFGTVYGAQQTRMTEIFDGDHEAAAQHLAFMRRTFPKLSRLRSESYAMHEENSFVTDMFGRRYRMPWELRHKSVNARIQGGTANIVKRAMARVQNYLRPHGGTLLLQIHDELAFEVPKPGARKHARAVARIMSDVAQEVLHVPFPVKCSRWSPSLADQKEVKL